MPVFKWLDCINTVSDYFLGKLINLKENKYFLFFKNWPGFWFPVVLNQRIKIQ